MRPCGNADCGCSTGIHEGLTFGRGELNYNGFWSIPCRVCAVANDDSREETIQHFRDKYFQLGFTKQQIDDTIADMEWLLLPAWPYE